MVTLGRIDSGGFASSPAPPMRGSGVAVSAGTREQLTAICLDGLREHFRRTPPRLSPSRAEAPGMRA